MAVELKDCLHFILHTKLKPLGNCRHGRSPTFLPLLYHICSVVKSKKMENFTNSKSDSSLQDRWFFFPPLLQEAVLFNVFLFLLHYILFHMYYWAVSLAVAKHWYFDVTKRVLLISFVPSLHYRYCKNWNVQEHAKCRNHKENDRRIWWGIVCK